MPEKRVPPAEPKRGDFTVTVRAGSRPVDLAEWMTRYVRLVLSLKTPKAHPQHEDEAA